MAGEEWSTRSPICPCQASVRNFPLLGLMVFSTGFTPVRVVRFLKDGQLVWTLNLAEAVEPLVCPVAWMVWDPGCADFATTMGAMKLPELSAVALPADAVSKAKVTISDGEKPEPFALILLPGGAMAGEIDSEAAAATAERLAIRMTSKMQERMFAVMRFSCGGTTATLGFL